MTGPRAWRCSCSRGRGGGHALAAHPDAGGTTVAFFRAASYAASASNPTPLTNASAKATSDEVPVIRSAYPGEDQREVQPPSLYCWTNPSVSTPAWVGVSRACSRPGRPVGVPEAVVDVDLAVHDLRAGVRRGVGARHRREGRRVPVRRTDLLETGVGVQVQPVQAGVQGGELVLARALDLHPAEQPVPLPLGPLLDRVEAGLPRISWRRLSRAWSTLMSEVARRRVTVRSAPASNRR